MNKNIGGYKISLKAARVNANLTQKDVAKEMHVTPQTVVNWETGKIKPKPAEFEMMCRIYSVPEELIFFA